MKWQEYKYQPCSLMGHQDSITPEFWLAAVQHKKLLRIGEFPLVDVQQVETIDVAESLGRFFAPDAEVSLDVVQVAGLLIKRELIDLDRVLLSARQQGGALYINWFLYHLDLLADNPLPECDFPLHASRWKKKKAGSHSASYA